MDPGHAGLNPHPCSPPPYSLLHACVQARFVISLPKSPPSALPVGSARALIGAQVIAWGRTFQTRRTLPPSDKMLLNLTVTSNAMWGGDAKKALPLFNASMAVEVRPQEYGFVFFLTWSLSVQKVDSAGVPLVRITTHLVSTFSLHWLLLAYAQILHLIGICRPWFTSPASHLQHNSYPNSELRWCHLPSPWLIFCSLPPFPHHACRSPSPTVRQLST